MQQAVRAQRVWNSKIPLVKAALSRHNLASLTGLLEQAANTDGSIKGFADGRPWDNLASLVTGISQGAGTGLEIGSSSMVRS
jgi:DNA polymerase-3 subunit delta